MTREEALKHINDSTVESKRKLDDIVRNLHLANIKLDVKNFISIMFDVIRYKWSKQYPETFLICYVTGDEYTKLPKAMYTYYMSTVNGSLNEFMKINELDDFHIYCMGLTDENILEMFRKRLKVIEDILNNDDIDIVIWCLNNVCI